jgi:ATP-dependent DNA ligase
MRSMTASLRVMRPTDLRLMPFGRTGARAVRDGLWEPLWAGRRALVDVLGGRVRIRNEHDEALEGFDILREAIRERVRADELVLDGYLMPAPLRSSVGAEAPMGMDSVMTPAQAGRQLILGGGIGNDRREELIAAQSRRRSLPSASPTAFVAVDLLWIDGEPIVDVPLLERKRLLESALEDGEIVRRTVAVRPPVEVWFAQWRALGFHQLAVKGANSRYTPGRPNGEWATAFIPKR